MKPDAGGLRVLNYMCIVVYTSNYCKLFGVLLTLLEDRREVR